MSAHNSLVASYTSRSRADAAVAKLESAGFDRSQLFVAARERRISAGESEDAETLAELRELDDTLYRLGVPQENVADYESEFKTGRLLLAAHGTPDEILQARRIVDADHPDGWDGNVGCAVYYGCPD